MPGLGVCHFNCCWVGMPKIYGNHRVLSRVPQFHNLGILQVKEHSLRKGVILEEVFSVRSGAIVTAGASNVALQLPCVSVRNGLKVGVKLLWNCDFYLGPLCPPENTVLARISCPELGRKPTSATCDKHDRSGTHLLSDMIEVTRNKHVCTAFANPVRDILRSRHDAFTQH